MYIRSTFLVEFVCAYLHVHNGVWTGLKYVAISYNIIIRSLRCELTGAIQLQAEQELVATPTVLKARGMAWHVTTISAGMINS